MKMPSLHTAFIHDIVKEMRDKPITMMVIIALYVLVPATILYQFTYFASAEAVADVKEKMESLQKNVDLTAQLNISDRLRQLAKLRCENDVSVENKLRINTAIEEWQVRYKEITGSRYDIPECRFL